MKSVLQNKTQEQIEALARKNLENLNKLCEVKMSNYIKLTNNLEILKLERIKKKI